MLLHVKTAMQNPNTVVMQRKNVPLKQQLEAQDCSIHVHSFLAIQYEMRLVVQHEQFQCATRAHCFTQTLGAQQQEGRAGTS